MKKSIAQSRIPEHLHHFYELEFNGEIIKPKTLLRIKGERGTFRYVKHVHNSKLDVTWIDTISTKTGLYRSFYLDRIRAIATAKVSRRRAKTK